MNEYCDFMNKYAGSDGTDAGMLNDYANYIDRYAQMVQDFEAWEDDELNAAEEAYYVDVQARVSKHRNRTAACRYGVMTADERQLNSEQMGRGMNVSCGFFGEK